jgi:hypothetical protein
MGEMISAPSQKLAKATDIFLSFFRLSRGTLALPLGQQVNNEIGVSQSISRKNIVPHYVRWKQGEVIRIANLVIGFEFQFASAL